THTFTFHTGNHLLPSHTHTNTHTHTHKRFRQMQCDADCLLASLSIEELNTCLLEEHTHTHTHTLTHTHTHTHRHTLSGRTRSPSLTLSPFLLCSLQRPGPLSDFVVVFNPDSICALPLQARG